MKYSEELLQSWTFPLSKSEEERVENTIKMIRSALDDSNELNKMDIEVFAQGSYANNTNVRAESDVDICVLLKDAFYSEYPKGKSIGDYGFTKKDITFYQYRDMVKCALQKKFRSEHVEDGNKSIVIHENSYHVNADVVPAFQFRNYYYLNSTDSNRYIEGIWFKAKDGKEVKNYPKRHIKNGTNKNNATNYRYKKLVRIMKHVKNNMVEEGITDGNKISSFLVECLVYKIPDSIITGYSTWTETLRQAIVFLYSAIKDEKHTEWCEVSDMLYLFRGRKWTDQDVKNWLVDAWNYLGYGK